MEEYIKALLNAGLTTQQIAKRTNVAPLEICLFQASLDSMTILDDGIEKTIYMAKEKRYVNM